jgi:hypothetical protein
MFSMENQEIHPIEKCNIGDNFYRNAYKKVVAIGNGYSEVIKQHCRNQFIYLRYSHNDIFLALH